MNAEQIAKLKELAQTATPGPWSTGTTSRQKIHEKLPPMYEAAVHVGDDSNRGNCLATIFLGGRGALHSDLQSVSDNAAYIAAANPAAILELIALAERALSAQDEVPAHETIIENDGNLLCTACGTTAPSPAVAVEPVAWTSANLLHSLKIAREVAKIPSNHSVAMRAAKRFEDDVPLYATPSPSLAVRDVVDAARYRFLRNNGVPTTDAEIEKALTVYQGIGLSSLLPDEIDAAVDAAMREQP